MHKHLLSFFLVCAALFLSACGNGGNNNSSGTDPAPVPPATYTVGGSITGLSTGTLVLKNNGGDPVSLVANSPTFTFVTPMSSGQSYAVTVESQPAGLTCAVSNGSGTIGATNVTNVAIICATNTYTLGGTVSGLASGTLGLQNSGGNVLSLSSNGAFAFPTALPEGFAYNVTVANQPLGLSCAVSNGTGSINGANVNNVNVACGAATLETSIANMALVTSGASRMIVLTNTGTLAAQGLSISTSPAFPSGTTIATTCTSTLAPSASCTFSITPGATASAAAGSAPTPSVITVTASNTNTATVNVSVLQLGNIYQGGYLFAIDDSTAVTSSVGGKVAALTDQSSGIVWGESTPPAPVTGINENSTTPCQGNSDGQCNTNQIVTTLSPGIPLTDYAAGLCKATINGYTDWYLPAICEIGTESVGPGAGCVIGTPNMQASLVANYIGGFQDPGYYWSSTQFSGNPTYDAWQQYLYSTGPHPQNLSAKSISAQLHVRCARSLTP